MARKIYKYPIAWVKEQEIPLPKGYKILDIQWQQETLTMWVEVDLTRVITEPCRIVRVFIGATMPKPKRMELKYIKTIQDGDEVGHFYEDSY